MKKKQVSFLRRTGSLIFAFFFLAGCASGRKVVRPERNAQKKTTVAAPPVHEKKKLFDDAIRFIDLEEVDLDKDGKKELVAIYVVGPELRGVKVVKFKDKDRKEGAVIFKRIFSGFEVRLEERNGIPTLIAENRDYQTGQSTKATYVWDAKESEFMEARP